ncbi:Solute carrier family 13 like protein, partial [Aduncisulcus paluster]
MAKKAIEMKPEVHTIESVSVLWSEGEIVGDGKKKDKKCIEDPRFPTSKIVGLVIALVSAIICWSIPMDKEKPTIQYCAGCVLLIAFMWIFEVLPLAITSFFPLILFPLFGIQKGSEVASNYMKSTIFTFLGGFIMALAMQRWNLHTRIALRIVVMTKGKPGLLLFGMMAVTWFLSMWISNTATVMSMMPNVLAIANELESSLGKDRTHKFTLAMLIGVAFSASIGGIGTLIGTPPNLALDAFLKQTFQNVGETFSFSTWF